MYSLGWPFGGVTDVMFGNNLGFCSTAVLGDTGEGHV